ncbi:SCAN domain-containing protein 3-like 1 [Homarus americanus]|uniref:SCAN domain-containing protein 3-like 1 n=1 Tax=Homarus americanus TaxID=6706 RepID=A0A8J5JRK1_HOMAM|nr:SCAN domain-containing protein 3-like 1 [Homarus americanus]
MATSGAKKRKYNDDINYGFTSILAVGIEKPQCVLCLKVLANDSMRPKFEEEEGKLVRNPFSGTLDIAAMPDDVQDEFLDLRNDSAARDLYEEKSLTVCSSIQSVVGGCLADLVGSRFGGRKLTGTLITVTITLMLLSQVYDLAVVRSSWREWKVPGSCVKDDEMNHC